MAQRKEDRSLGDLFADLSQEISTLVREELALAKIELSDKASRVGKDVGMLAVGGAVAYAGFLALVAMVTIALAFLIGSWVLSALIVTVVLLAIGYVLVRRGLDALQHQDIAPRQTLDTIKMNVDFTKDQLR